MSNLYLFLSINYHNVDLFLVDSSNKYNHGKIYEMNKAFDYGEISEIMHDRSFINFLKEQGRYLKQRFGNKKIQLVLYINHVFIDIEKKIFDKNFFDPISIKEQILSENLHTKNNDLFYFCHKNKYYRYILRNNNFYLLLNDIKKHLQCDKGLIIDNNVLLNIWQLFDDNNIIQFNPRATYVHKNDQKHKIDIGAEKLLQILLETFNLNSLEQLAKLYHIFNLEQFTKNLRNESLITSTYHGEVNRHTSLKKTMFLIKNENVSNKFVDALAKICTINNNNPIVWVNVDSDNAHSLETLVQLCFKNCKIITPKTIFQRLNDIVFNNNTIYHNNFTNNFRPQILHENIMLINKDEVERSELC